VLLTESSKGFKHFVVYLRSNKDDMIEYLRGKLADLEPTMATVDCMGVGYGVNITLNTYAAIQGKEDVKLWIYESIREDAYQLWGFSSKVEREVFLLLITVSGIGANTARMILSALTPQELCSIISSGNAKMLTQVKGIGPKAAQRIIVDLGDKIMALAADASVNDRINHEIEAEERKFLAQPDGCITSASLKKMFKLKKNKIVI
jgi:Holliday junction DNA helicase RuvA